MFPSTKGRPITVHRNEILMFGNKRPGYSDQDLGCFRLHWRRCETISENAFIVEILDGLPDSSKVNF